MRPVHRYDVGLHGLRRCIGPVEQDVRLAIIAKRLQHVRCSDQIALRIDKKSVSVKRVAKPLRTGSDVVGINDRANGCSKRYVRRRLLLGMQRRYSKEKQCTGEEARSNNLPIPAASRWTGKNPRDWG